MMLAEAAEAVSEGPLADFAMNDRDRYELKIAALLHDCGKVTTPVHVVDKATKLQTIFDRIHLIDTRFEVVRRDEELAMLRCGGRWGFTRCRGARLAGHGTCGRSMPIGISCDTSMSAARRCWRPIRRACGRFRSVIAGVTRRAKPSTFSTTTKSKIWTIRAGTLTQAEREIINYHIVATIKMLESLPWPKHLRHVPEYAGGHHERMDGKGYPKGLKRDEMSVQARIMGIADIFEALTARDRPYKPALKISEALGIMAGFSRNGHVDPDLFEVFVRQKVYLRYAQQYLEPTQIDTVPGDALP